MKIKKPAKTATNKPLKLKKPSTMVEVKEPRLYPVIGLATLDNTRLRYNPKTKGLVAFVTSTADDVDVAWDLCSQCHLYIENCRCAGGSHPPSYLKHFDGSMKMIDMGDAEIPASMIGRVQREVEAKAKKAGAVYKPAKAGKGTPARPPADKPVQGRTGATAGTPRPVPVHRKTKGKVVVPESAKPLKVKRPKGSEVDLDKIDQGHIDNAAEKAAKDAADMFRSKVKVKKPKPKGK